MIIQHNMLANFTQRELKISTGQKAKSTEKLSSGYRINRSADDAAGLTISESMRWNIRGLDKASKNCQDGASMMQVADGALTEVHAMLDRMKELSVQAANDTNTQEDRQAIQREMNQLVQEIDRIGDTTEFNTRKLFQGSEVDVIDQNTGRRINASDIPISDFSVGDVELIGEPFKEYPDDPKRTNSELNLGVVLKGNYNVSGTQYPLIYKGGFAGSTSNTRFYYRIGDDDGNSSFGSIDMSEMKKAEISHTGNSYTRTFTYEPKQDVKFQIKQNVTIGQNDGTSQGYSISYDIYNMSSSSYTSWDSAIYMNIDTSYGGTHQGDYDEQYFVDGEEIDKYNVYMDGAGLMSARSVSGGKLGSIDSKLMEYYINNRRQRDHYEDFNSAKSFSIFNLANPELPFSEYVNFSEGANIITFGEYGTGVKSLEAINKGGGMIGSNTANGDKTFSAWFFGTTETSEMMHIDALEIGIKKKTADPNLTGLDVSGRTGKLHSETMDLWIQSGSTEKSGFFVSIGEMNSDVLGLRKLDVSSYAAASDANDRVDKAIQKISGQRTLIGVQQNRMEYASKIDDNTSENTQYAESRIRDTDMAKEMVNYSKHNIVEQMGQNMLAQANQSTQGVMSLLG